MKMIEEPTSEEKKKRGGAEKRGSRSGAERLWLMEENQFTKLLLM